MSSSTQKNQNFDILLSKPNTSQTSAQKSFFGHDFSNLKNFTFEDSKFKKNLLFSNINNKKRRFSEILNTSNSTFPTNNTLIKKNRNSYIPEIKKDNLNLINNEQINLKEISNQKLSETKLKQKQNLDLIFGTLDKFLHNDETLILNDNILASPYYTSHSQISNLLNSYIIKKKIKYPEIVHSMFNNEYDKEFSFNSLFLPLNLIYFVKGNKIILWDFFI